MRSVLERAIGYAWAMLDYAYVRDEAISQLEKNFPEASAEETVDIATKLKEQCDKKLGIE